MLGSAYRALLHAEANEVGWVFLSIPAVAATFALSYLVIVAMASVVGCCKRVNVVSVVAAAGLAVAGLWGIGKLCEGAVQRSREVAILRFHGASRTALWLSPDEIREDPTRLEGRRQQAILLLLENGVAVARFTSSEYAFQPPLSAVLLWQGPYRAGY
jgi:hypothetical protein